MEKIYTQEEIAKIIEPIARNHDIDKIYLFGSYARKEATENSDVDLHVESCTLHGLFALGSLYAELEDALNKKVDIVTTKALVNESNNKNVKDFFDNIKEEEIIIYER